MTALAVELRDLSLSLGQERILGPLSLDLEPGSYTLLSGPSGSGKTSLLRLIAGLLAPDAGEVHLFGRLASANGKLRVRPEQRSVGMLFQSAALWPHMNAARTLAFVLSAAGVPKGERPARIAELLRLVELEGFEKRLPASLSGGQAQRLALARALAAKPRLVLLDEPLGPMDAELREALLERLAALRERLGFTTVHVTHDPGEARALADRTLWLRDGQLHEDDAP